MVHGVLFDGVCKVSLRLAEVTLEEHEDAKGEKHLSIGWILLIRCHESILDLDEVKVATVSIGNFLVLWMVFEPLEHVVEGVLFDKLVREADTKGKQAVQIVWILLMCLFESDDGLLVLI